MSPASIIRINGGPIITPHEYLDFTMPDKCYAILENLNSRPAVVLQDRFLRCWASYGPSVPNGEQCTGISGPNGNPNAPAVPPAAW